jgi:hypothetical protein
MFLARQYDVTCMSGVCKKFHEWIKGSMEERKGSLSQWINNETIVAICVYLFCFRTIHVCVPQFVVWIWIRHTACLSYGHMSGRIAFAHHYFNKACGIV